MLCLRVLKFHDAVFGAGLSSSHVLYVSEFPYFLSKKLLPLRVHSQRAMALSVREFCPERSARGSVCFLRVLMNDL